MKNHILGASNAMRKVGPAFDVDQLLAKGSLAGPYRVTRPLTVSLGMRFVRAVRKLIRLTIKH